MSVDDESCCRRSIDTCADCRVGRSKNMGEAVAYVGLFNRKQPLKSAVEISLSVARAWVCCVVITIFKSALQISCLSRLVISCYEFAEKNGTAFFWFISNGKKKSYECSQPMRSKTADAIDSFPPLSNLFWVLGGNNASVKNGQSPSKHFCASTTRCVA